MTPENPMQLLDACKVSSLERTGATQDLVLEILAAIAIPCSDHKVLTERLCEIVERYSNVSIKIIMC